MEFSKNLASCKLHLPSICAIILSKTHFELLPLHTNFFTHERNFLLHFPVSSMLSFKFPKLEFHLAVTLPKTPPSSWISSKSHHNSQPTFMRFRCTHNRAKPPLFQNVYHFSSNNEGNLVQKEEKANV